MKQYSVITFVIAFVLMIIFYPHTFGVRNIQAVETKTPTEMTQVSTDGAMMKKKSEYFLPYPGILPDHPLYFLKDLRDKIIEMIIVDPERKSEFYLLQSDKLLNAAVSLIDNNQTDKALTVVLESSNKMSAAVSQLSGLKANGQQVETGLIEKIKKAIEKHSEVLEDVSSKIDIAGALSELQQSQEELMKLQ